LKEYFEAEKKFQKEVQKLEFEYYKPISPDGVDIRKISKENKFIPLVIIRMKIVCKPDQQKKLMPE
jgi:hypothetical protein